MKKSFLSTSVIFMILIALLFTSCDLDSVGKKVKNLSDIFKEDNSSDKVELDGNDNDPDRNNEQKKDDYTYDRDDDNYEIVKLSVRDVTDGPEGKLNNQAGNSYSATNMFDSNPSTGWAVRLSQTNYDSQPYLYGPMFKVNGSKIDHIVIRNGYHKNSDIFKKNTRASWIRISRASAGNYPSSSDILWEGPLSDTMSPQTLYVSRIYDQSRPTERLIITFSSKDDDQYYHGSKWDDLVISELEFWGKE